MSTLPLDVHEVLEQEYEAIHGRLEGMPEAPYRAGDIIDAEWAKVCLAACKLPGDPLAVLNAIIDSGKNIEKLEDSPALTDTGRELLALCDDSAKTPELRRRIADEALSGAVRTFRDVRLEALYAKLHAQPDESARTALCISGGGIRSATFALGVIQGLASSGVLSKFDYLSTVSGGGYIGSWLSSWSRRHKDGMEGVEADLVRADTGRVVDGTRKRPETKVDPEPRPLKHLREYSNYLTPRLGLFSADGWTLASLYVRNLTLNLLVLVPVLAALLALPRLYANLLQGNLHDSVNFLGGITVAGLAIGFSYLGAARPVRHGRESTSWLINTNRWFIGACVLPLTVAGFGLTTFWAEASQNHALLRDAMWWGIACAVAMTVLPCAAYYYRYLGADFAERRQSASRAHGRLTARKFTIEVFAALVGLVTAAGLFLLIAKKLFPNPRIGVPNPHDLEVWKRVLTPLPMAELYVCFAVPLVLLVFFVQATIFVGLSSRWNEDYDREWWGRAGALLLMFAVFGGAASFISVFGPVLLYRAPMILGSMGGISGIAAALLGKSSKTPANGDKDTGSSATTALLGLAVPLFALTLLAAISLGTTALIQAIEPDKGVSLDQFKVQSQFSATVNFVQSRVQRSEVKLPLASVEVERGVRHLLQVHNTTPIELWSILGVAVAAALFSRRIGVNRFSMQGLYRNRIIRAYLGASRYSRDPDRFTGFDENDNLQMYELRPQLLWTTSFDDPGAFLDQLLDQKSDLATTLWYGLDAALRNKIETQKKAKQPYASTLISGVVQQVNVLMQTIDLTSGEETGTPVQMLLKNRQMIEDTFPSVKQLGGRRQPFHVVNTALNVVSGEKLAWQQRMAASLTVSPLHAGSVYLGYRDSREYGGDDGISLGTAVAISGAAASPNQGYHSSLPLAFIMTLLNVRLGSWLGNPGLHGQRSFTESSPHGNLETLFWEMTGNTNMECPWVYLSDGGHFENLALYEMVLRRCRFIVVSDGGCDPTFTFEDLGNAIRKIRTDFGVPIEIQSRDMFPRAVPGKPLESGSYIATATIRYSAIDPGAKDGTLIYLKPSVYDEDYLPRDVYNYCQESKDFPHETTADQFFSESQFESYRALGRHVVDVICGNDGSRPAAGFSTVAAFAMHAKARADAAAKKAKTNIVSAVTSGTADIALAIRDLPKQAPEQPSGGGAGEARLHPKDPKQDRTTA